MPICSKHEKDATLGKYPEGNPGYYCSAKDPAGPKGYCIATWDADGNPKRQPAWGDPAKPLPQVEMPGTHHGVSATRAAGPTTDHRIAAGLAAKLAADSAAKGVSPKSLVPIIEAWIDVLYHAYHYKPKPLLPQGEKKDADIPF